MRRWWTLSLLAIAVAALAFLVSETRRLAAMAGQGEIAVRAAQRERDLALARLDAESAARAVVAADAARLGAELATATTQLQGMSEVLETRSAEFARVRAEAEAAELRRNEPMSEGVRLCLAALHDCLRAEGFANQRFVRARRLDADGLHEVEMYQLDADGLGVTFLVAGRMTAELDRAKARLVLRFFDGHRLVGEASHEFGPDGFPVVFEPVDGRMLEQRLPYLVRAAGVYPEPVTKGATTDVDPVTRRQWLERFDRLLAQAGTTQSLRIGRFRGMADGYFLQVELIGTDQRFHVLSSAHCARLAVEIDKTANVVSLLLKDGVLRDNGVESTITGDGYRMLLPKLDPKQASDLMFGMVVTK